jgi:hypothetical protein
MHPLFIFLLAKYYKSGIKDYISRINVGQLDK